MQAGFVHTKMAAAFLAAIPAAVEAGVNPGAIGKRILTNNAKGVGVKYRPKLTLKKKKEVPADSAVEVVVGE